MINPMNNSMKRALLMGMLAATMAGDLPKAETEKPRKKCLVCGDWHSHNNSFCSPECCKKYKTKREKVS